LAKFLKGVNNKDRKNKKNHKLYIFIYYSGHGVIAMEVDKAGKLKKDANGKKIFSKLYTYAVCPSEDGLKCEYFSLEEGGLNDITPGADVLEFNIFIIKFPDCCRTILNALEMQRKGDEINLDKILLKVENTDKIPT
jgi:hypothetical protein